MTEVRREVPAGPRAFLSLVLLAQGVIGFLAGARILGEAGRAARTGAAPRGWVMAGLNVAVFRSLRR